MSKIKDLRESMGFSQSVFGELTGLSFRSLQEYEQGRRSLVGAKLPTLLKICLTLNCRLDDIIDDAETLDLLRRYEER